MQIHHPLLSLVLLLAIIATTICALRWRVFVEPSEMQRRIFMLTEDHLLEAPRLSRLARFGWLTAALVLAYWLGRLQNWIA